MPANYATTVFPAKEALDALLRAHDWTAPAPTVAWDAPTEAEDVVYDAIFQNPPSFPAADFMTLSGRLDETYNLIVVIDVRTYGDDLQGTERRAWELFNDLMRLILNNPTLSGTVNRVTHVGFPYDRANPSPVQWQVPIVVEIGVVGLVRTDL